MPPKNFGNYFEMVFADIATFGKAPLVTSSSLPQADLAVFGIPWDLHGDATSRRAPRAPGNPGTVDLVPRGLEPGLHAACRLRAGARAETRADEHRRLRRRHHLARRHHADVGSIRAAAKSVAEKGRSADARRRPLRHVSDLQGVRDAHPARPSASSRSTPTTTFATTTRSMARAGAGRRCAARSSTRGSTRGRSARSGSAAISGR